MTGLGKTERFATGILLTAFATALGPVACGWPMAYVPDPGLDRRTAASIAFASARDDEDRPRKKAPRPAVGAPAAPQGRADVFAVQGKCPAVESRNKAAGYKGTVPLVPGETPRIEVPGGEPVVLKIEWDLGVRTCASVVGFRPQPGGQYLLEYIAPERRDDACGAALSRKIERPDGAEWNERAEPVVRVRLGEDGIPEDEQELCSVATIPVDSSGRLRTAQGTVVPAGEAIAAAAPATPGPEAPSPPAEAPGASPPVLPTVPSATQEGAVAAPALAEGASRPAASDGGGASATPGPAGASGGAAQAVATAEPGAAASAAGPVATPAPPVAARVESGRGARYFRPKPARRLGKPTAGTGIGFRFGLSFGGDVLVRATLTSGSTVTSETIRAGDGMLAAVSASWTPLWIERAFGVGGHAEVGFLYSSIDGSNGSVSLSRFPLSASLQLLMGGPERVWFLVRAGVRKDGLVALSSSVGGGGQALLTSSVGPVGELGIYYAVSRRTAMDFTVRGVLLDYSGESAWGVGATFGGHLTY